MLRKIDESIGMIREEGLLDNYYEDIDCSPSGDAIYLVPKKDGMKQNRFGKIPGKIKFTEYESKLDEEKHLCLYLSSDMNGVEMYKSPEENIAKFTELKSTIEKIIIKINEVIDFCDPILKNKSFMKDLFKNEIDVLETETRTDFSFDYEDDKYIFRVNNIDYWFYSENTDLIEAMKDVLNHIYDYKESIVIIITLLHILKEKIWVEKHMMFDKINESLLEDLSKTNIKFPEVDHSCLPMVDIYKDVEEHGSAEAKKLMEEYKKQMEENDMINKNKTNDTVQKILSSKVNGSKTSDTVQKILSSKVNNK